MTCRLLQHIKHTFDYNPGGITNVYLLDIRDFKAYRFAEEGLFDKCYVQSILTPEPFLELDAVSESTFSESHENGIYKQELTTFVRTLSGTKLSNLLIAQSNRYLVAFRTSQGTVFTFGSDGGASLRFSQISGQMGETSGYQIVLSKNSVYPLFEVDASRFNTIPVLGTESKAMVITEDGKNVILI
ncbi:MAG: hypothetical protein E6767_02475 [Dysgonomonas sp.]|nr:hypothetical protein [Dysgonomonas sp.]